MGTIFNIGSSEEVTINELAAVVKEVTGSSSPVRYVSYEEAYGKDFEDMFRRVPDLSRVRDTIGYAPTKNLREIVQAVANSLVDRRRSETGVPGGLANAVHAD